MPPTVTCPVCRQSLQVPDELLGQEVRCPACKHPFVAAALPAAPGAPPAPAHPADAAPDRGPARPPFTILYTASGRAGAVLTFGLLSVVGAIVGAVVCAPLVVVPFVLGLTAWFMGRSALAAARDGTGDPAAAPLIATGRRLGLVGVLISGLVMLVMCGLALLSYGIISAVANRP